MYTGTCVQVYTGTCVCIGVCRRVYVRVCVDGSCRDRLTPPSHFANLNF